MNSLILKAIRPESAETIVTIHYDAVHEGNARRFYHQKLLNAWSPPVTPQRIQGMRQKMRETHPEGFIASIGGEAVGFGLLDLELGRIGAIYVKAAFTGNRIGSRILQALEDIAISNGCTKLELEASLNAKPFYEQHGYNQTAEAFFTLPSGVQMQCVKMNKPLQNKPCE